MIEKIKKFHGHVKNFVVNVLFQKFLVPAALIFIYFFVVGPTSIFARLFFRKALNHSVKTLDSSWGQAEGYNPSLEDSLKQS